MFSDMASKVFEGQIPGSLLKKKHWGNTENFMDFVSLDKGKLLTACVNSGLYKMTSEFEKEVRKIHNRLGIRIRLVF